MSVPRTAKLVPGQAGPVIGGIPGWAQSTLQYRQSTSNMAVILAIETSTEACSCALAGPDGVHEIHEVIPRQHAREILPMVSRLLNEHGLTFGQLDAIACSRGPGSFTGLRINAGVVQGLAFAAELPVIAVSTLATMALQINEISGNRYTFACLDARISEVYCGFFDCSSPLPLLFGEEMLVQPSLLELPGECRGLRFSAGGNGLEFRNEFRHEVLGTIEPCDTTLLPRAGALARLAVEMHRQDLLMQPEALIPVYLRDQVARKPGEA
jgi:tRNA threonylcarbamoyladenosine biosynthesis protein TsaB